MRSNSALQPIPLPLLSRVVSLFIILLLSACGGGGSGGDPDSVDGSGGGNDGGGGQSGNNQVPVAVTGFSLTTSSNNHTVTFDGSNSYDSDGSISSYLWQQVSGPDVAIINSTFDVASFEYPLVDASTTFEFSLTVTDDDGLEDRETFTLSLEPLLDGSTNLVGPVSIGYVETPDYAENVLVKGDYAYVADTESGVQIIDISHPRSPQVVAFFDTAYPALDVAVSDDGKTLFIVDERNLYSIDITTPATPQVIQSVDDDRFGGKTIYLEGSRLYISRYDGLSIIDVTDPSAMILIGNNELYEIANANDIHVVGGIVYLVNDGLKILDARNPSNITLLGSMDTEANGLSLVADIAFIAAGEDGVRAINVADPASLIEVNTFGPDHHLVAQREADSIFVHDNIAYVGAKGTVQVWDVQDLANPEFLGQTISRTRTDSLVVQDKLAYVVGYSGLEVIDIHDPISLISQDNFIREVDSISEEAIADDAIILTVNGGFDVFAREDTKHKAFPGWTIGTVADKRIYGISGESAVGSAQLTILDASDPNNLNELSTTALPATGAFANNQFFNFAAVDNDQLLASYTNGHAHLVDISNTSNPIAEHINLAQYGYPGIVGFRGDIIYAVASDDSLAVVDIADRNNVTELSRTTINEEFYMSPLFTIVDGDILYVTTTFAFHVYDMQTPTNPVWLNTIPLDRTNRMVKQGDLIFIALGQSGSGSAVVIDVAIPASPAVTYLETGTKTVQSVFINQDTVIFQGYDAAATRVYDFTPYIIE